ncbi:MAG: hypothetical protein ACYC0J_09560 [Gammaproteobacteria bacterium]
MRFMILGLAILLASCATTTNNYYSSTVRSWQGANAHDLVKTWGSADIQATGPNGYTAYVYKTESYRAYNTVVSPQIGVNFTPSGRPILISQPNLAPNASRGMGLVCTTLFTANPKGIIIDTAVNGTGCYGGARFAEKYRHPITR